MGPQGVEKIIGLLEDAGLKVDDPSREPEDSSHVNSNAFVHPRPNEEENAAYVEITTRKGKSSVDILNALATIITVDYGSNETLAGVQTPADETLLMRIEDSVSDHSVRFLDVHYPNSK